MPDYPEHDRLAKIKDKSQAIGEFIRYLMDERHISFMIWDDGEECEVPLMESVEDMLADYFGINRPKLESEKRKMLEEMRANAG